MILNYSLEADKTWSKFSNFIYYPCSIESLVFNCFYSRVLLSKGLNMMKTKNLFALFFLPQINATRQNLLMSICLDRLSVLGRRYFFIQIKQVIWRLLSLERNQKPIRNIPLFDRILSICHQTKLQLILKNR